MVVLIFAREGTLGRLLAQHRVLHRRQFAPPLLFALDDLVVGGLRLGVGHGVVCRRCVEACEHSAIRILAREKLGAVIDAAACTGCGDCIPVCPVEAIALAPRDRIALVSELANLVVHNG